MVKEVLLQDVLNNLDRYTKEVLKGKIFVYPTDTVYGIGGNAYDEDVISRIYKIKRRDKSKPLSVIAPSEEWILEHFDISKMVLRIYFPGPYTLLLKKKDPNFLSYASYSEFVGVRIPDHPVILLINKAKVPFVTTSANLSGYIPAGKIEDVDESIKGKVDYVIVGECKFGKPSTVINPYRNEILRK